MSRCSCGDSSGRPSGDGGSRDCGRQPDLLIAEHKTLCGSLVVLRFATLGLVTRLCGSRNGERGWRRSDFGASTRTQKRWTLSATLFAKTPSAAAKEATWPAWTAPEQAWVAREQSEYLDPEVERKRRVDFRSRTVAARPPWKAHENAAASEELAFLIDSMLFVNREAPPKKAPVEEPTFGRRDHVEIVFVTKGPAPIMILTFIRTEPSGS